jgi:hypothetical protein
VAKTSANVLAWVTLAVISFAWLGTKRLDAAPWWGVMAALTINALPGGVLLGLGRAVITGLADKLPSLGKKP